MQKYKPKNGEQSIPVLKIRELKQGFCDANSEMCLSDIDKVYIIKQGDIIFSWSASLLLDVWTGQICGLNQHLFKVVPNKYNKWFVYAWTNKYMTRFVSIALDKATTMGHIKHSDLNAAVVIIPPKKEYEYLCNLISPLYDSILSLRISNYKLMELRDFLLPKLMSGEINVSKIDI